MRVRTLFAALTAVALSCSAVQASAKTVKIGVTAGMAEQVAEAVRSIVKDQDIDLKVVVFSDYVLPNQALESKDLDINSFQHKPYLDAQVKTRGYKLVSVANTYVAPMGIYSEKIKTLDTLPSGARVAIPNDPSNGGRALLLLAKQGVLTLRDGVGVTPSVTDIVANPKALRIQELDAAQLPRSLPDVDAAAINTNYALQAKLDPTKDAIAIEDGNSPYANILAVREEDKDAPWLKPLIEAFHSDKTRAFIQSEFKGAIIPAF